MDFIGDSVVEEPRHVATDELDWSVSPRPVSVGLPERAVQLPARHRDALAFAVAIADYLAEFDVLEICGAQPEIVNCDGFSRIWVDQTAVETPAARNLVRVFPVVPQLCPVPANYKHRRTTAQIPPATPGGSSRFA